MRCLMVGLALVACSCSSSQKRSDPPAPGTPGSGLTKAEAIDVCRADGERAYLARLRCPDGRPVQVGQRGSVGLREGDGSRPATAEDFKKAFGPKDPADETTHVVDVFRVTCSGRQSSIFLDMYHCNKPAPDYAATGFTLAPQ